MMKEDLIELKEKREFLQKSAEVMKQAREEFDKNNAGLIKQIDLAKVDSLVLIDKIKKDALEIYKVNGNEKSIGYGVKVIDTNTISYNKKDAEKWALDHKLALSLNVKAFEKIAKAQTLDIVTYDTGHKATIPGKIEIGEDKDE